MSNEKVVEKQDNEEKISEAIYNHNYLTNANPYDIHSPDFEKLYIGISGLIGAGKTTLATALGKKLNLPVFYESQVNNVYLDDFYKDMKKYSFSFQVYLLNDRFRQQQFIIWQGKGGIQDRTIYEDSIFAKMLADNGLMEKRDFLTYKSLFSNMSNFMKKPNIIIHLDVSPEESLKRIKGRSRNCETSITIDYLQNLYKGYEEFLQSISRIIPVIRINWNQFKDSEEMANIIIEHHLKLGNIKNVSFE